MSEPDIDLPGDWENDGGTRRTRRPHRGRRALLIILLILVVLVAAAGIIAARYLTSLNNSYEKRTTISIDDDRSGDTAGENFLLLGSDKRSPEAAAAEKVSGQRSDVMMLVHVPADHSGAYVMSFPRDLYVDIPGHGKDRINSAIEYGGVPLVVNTVEDYTGAHIDHVGLIDFEGIQGLVDALGGVDVQVPKEFTSNGVEFTQGSMHMDGKTALVFARERKTFADGDFQRNRDQQALLKGIIGELLDRDTLSSPSKISDTVEVVSPYLTTDDALTGSQLVKLGMSLRGIRGSDIDYLSVPYGDPYTTKGGASVVGSDEAGMKELKKALADDTMDQYVEDQENS
ncbi:LytR family transcriptional regulator [Brachybacterium endophyticum]|uniref:LytR family transcriptional regulator n=1 Tax=Brachybacterium endophyticum TaxID=2182385 RepID=A0A2U2RLC4_9MICO|nr:LCP family protein [Brachybacterium endophyticum]PWH06670.1 LytR family transcriptional regulator [Brachybacterium endophyticum]